MQRLASAGSIVGMALWRAIMQGIGWTVGREVAKDAIDELKGREEAPPQDPALVAARLEREARAAAKKLEEQRRAEAKRQKAQAKEVDRELEALKKQVARERKR